jgi:hypothetical protein
MGDADRSGWGVLWSYAQPMMCHTLYFNDVAHSSWYLTTIGRVWNMGMVLVVVPRRIQCGNIP